MAKQKNNQLGTKAAQSRTLIMSHFICPSFGFSPVKKIVFNLKKNWREGLKEILASVMQ